MNEQIHDKISQVNINNIAKSHTVYNNGNFVEVFGNMY